MKHNSENIPLRITLEEQAVWAAFDALSQILCDEIAQAAFEYDTIAILADYRAHKGDFFRGLSDYEYLQVMKDNFRRDLRQFSETKVENGKYRLERRNNVKKTVNVYGGSKSVRKDLQALPEGHAGRNRSLQHHGENAGGGW